jgi:hypothetical protein
LTIGYMYEVLRERGVIYAHNLVRAILQSICLSVELSDSFGL